MFKVVIIGSVENLALTEEVEGFVEFELIFGDEGLDINFELIFLASGDELDALVVSLNSMVEILFEGTSCKCFG